MGPPGAYENIALSPDGRSVAFDRGSTADVWVLDLDRMVTSRITSDPSDDLFPVWSPDGQSLVFSSNRGGFHGLYERTVGAVGDDRLLIRNDVPLRPSDWSHDGKYLLYVAGGDLWAFPLFGAHKPIQLTTSFSFQEAGARFSPDSRWIAYQSDESSGITRSGEGDVFVQSFPERHFTGQVSTSGGFAPRWSDDGNELFYVGPDGMLMAVSVARRESTLEFGAPKPLFPARLSQLSSGRPQYSVAHDGSFSNASTGVGPRSDGHRQLA